MSDGLLSWGSICTHKPSPLAYVQGPNYMICLSTSQVRILLSPDPPDSQGIISAGKLYPHVLQGVIQTDIRTQREGLHPPPATFMCWSPFSPLATIPLWIGPWGTWENKFSTAAVRNESWPGWWRNTSGGLGLKWRNPKRTVWDGISKHEDWLLDLNGIRKLSWLWP